MLYQFIGAGRFAEPPGLMIYDEASSWRVESSWLNSTSREAWKSLAFGMEIGVTASGPAAYSAEPRDHN
jgi:hypothetical protein